MIDLYAIGKEVYDREVDSGPTYHLFKLKRTYGGDLRWEPCIDCGHEKLVYSPCLDDLKNDHPNAIFLDFSKYKFSSSGYRFKEEHLIL